MGQICFAQIGVEFKNKLTPSFKDSELLNQAIREYIEKVIGKKGFDFTIYNFSYEEERNNINFELDSGKEKNLEWKLEMVVGFFKRIEPDLLDFNTCAWISMDLNYSINDLVD